MLAAHLRRLERPVRYAAMDPAHVRAIEIDRLRDLPAYHVPHGQQGLYRGTGLRNQAMAGDIHGLLGLHDLAADPSNDPAEAAGVHRQLEAGLRNRLIPHLAENFG